jgi:hypothetical protein
VLMTTDAWTVACETVWVSLLLVEYCNWLNAVHVKPVTCTWCQSSARTMLGRSKAGVGHLTHYGLMVIIALARCMLLSHKCTTCCIARV